MVSVVRSLSSDTPGLSDPDGVIFVSIVKAELYTNIDIFSILLLFTILFYRDTDKVWVLSQNRPLTQHPWSSFWNWGFSSRGQHCNNYIASQGIQTNNLLDTGTYYRLTPSTQTEVTHKYLENGVKFHVWILLCYILKWFHYSLKILL